MSVAPIILAGGFGERMYPVSTKELPKQYIKFLKSGESLFERTIKRVRAFLKSEEIIIVCNVLHRDVVIEQMSNLRDDNYVIILEPERKNTMISLLLALKLAECKHPELLFVNPTDSYIEDVASFSRCCQDAFDFCFLSGKHVLFGVRPTEANTNYGYIEMGEVLQQRSDTKTDDSVDVGCCDIYCAKSFKEKPDEQKAGQYLKSRNFLWNSGCFIFNYQTLFAELKQKHFEYVDFLQKIMMTKTGNKIFEVSAESADCFNSFKSSQIDKCFIEKSKNIACIKANFDWCDVGNIEALEKMVENGKIIL